VKDEGMVVAVGAAAKTTAAGAATAPPQTVYPHPHPHQQHPCLGHLLHPFPCRPNFYCRLCSCLFVCSCLFGPALCTLRPLDLPRVKDRYHSAQLSPMQTSQLFISLSLSPSLSVPPSPSFTPLFSFFCLPSSVLFFPLFPFLHPFSTYCGNIASRPTPSPPLPLLHALFLSFIGLASLGLFICPTLVLSFCVPSPFAPVFFIDIFG
jgi:hypothetical protein